jgi:glycosyltransferase involved in cell wall biosynthesis
MVRPMSTSYTARLTRKLRVASTAFGHPYDRSLYDPLRDRVDQCPSPLGIVGDPAVSLDDIDLFHLHWPEWLTFKEIAAHESIIAALADWSIPIVWTAHNLTPHVKNPAVFDPIYSRWAHSASTVIHHSHWGESKMRARYEFGANTEHVVIPHGHFGQVWIDRDRLNRREVEEEFGFAPCSLRIGILGAPRVEKRVVDFMLGFAACRRRDLQLAVWSLAPGERVPEEQRIVAAEPYRKVDSFSYAKRLATCDLLALPVDPDGEMLATGLVADAVGTGIPLLGSSWGYLTETVGDAAIQCGANAADITACLDRLTDEQVSRAAAACRARRPAYDWAPIAAATLDLFERLVRKAR